jgi:hypothetical protein
MKLIRCVCVIPILCGTVVGVGASVALHWGVARKRKRNVRFTHDCSKFGQAVILLPTTPQTRRRKKKSACAFALREGKRKLRIPAYANAPPRGSRILFHISIRHAQSQHFGSYAKKSQQPRTGATYAAASTHQPTPPVGTNHRRTQNTNSSKHRNERTKAKQARTTTYAHHKPSSECTTKERTNASRTGVEEEQRFGFSSPFSRVVRRARVACDVRRARDVDVWKLT